MRFLAVLSLVALGAVCSLGAAGCSKRADGAAPARRDAGPLVSADRAPPTAPGAAADGGTTPSSAAPADVGSPRAGMAWIPAGALKAGTPPDKAPRIADEELPGSEVSMSAFYIDLLPYPNEPGFHFGLVDEKFTADRKDLDVATTDAAGKSTVELNLSDLPDLTKPLAATVRVSVFEPSGRSDAWSSAPAAASVVQRARHRVTVIPCRPRAFAAACELPAV